MKNDINILSKKNLYNGFYKLTELTLKHKKHNGRWSKSIKREIFSGSHVATVLPYDPKKKKIVLINQFRAGVINQNINPIITEIVAGFISKNEKPVKAAIRECEEETGCKVINIKKMFSYFPSPGSSESYYHLYFAEVDSFNGIRITGQTDENEDILAKSYPITEVKELLMENNILNGLTLIALQWFFLKNYNNN